MKKLTSLILVLAFAGAFVACGKDKKDPRKTEETTTVETTAETTVEETFLELEPDEIQIRSICQLATLECYYNNVAKGTKSSGTGLSHIGEKERRFFVEYSAVATLGVDISEVSMDVEGDVIVVYLPEAKLLSSATIVSDSYGTDSFIQDNDNSLNSNEITAEDITKTINQSLEALNKKVGSDKTLLNNARERAKTLIKAYIEKLSETSGKNYKVIFKDARDRYS